MQQYADIYLLRTVASGWIFINIVLRCTEPLA